MESRIIDIDEDLALRPESEKKDPDPGSESKPEDADPEPGLKSRDLDFRPGSNIWSLYIEDAERAAKEKVELMKSGLLDSVLAGLFAGVVSSFVIDARRDIQDSSEQNLLSDIRDALRGSPIEVVHIPVSASWISALWLVSLYLTLFSAIMGILAKAWLANLIPTNTRREASDAYDRYKLDLECTYYLQPAITFMFLLIQIASILFLVGLVIQSITDHQTLGHVLLAFCLSGGLIYLTMGCLPFFTSLSSFRTPLSDFLLFLKNIFRRKDGPNTAPSIKDVNECLGEIFFVHLIKSPNPLRVDAAVAELSVLDFGEKWIQLLCRSEAPERVLTCFRLHASAPADDSYQQNETLSNYLLAFLRFAHQFEANTGGLAAELGEINKLGEYSTLLQTLKTLLEPGHPLHRRNTLPETLLPLRLALRTEVLCLFRQLPLEHSPSLHLMDFHSTEMDTCPWNRVQGDIRSSHRLYVTLAACRGALQAEKNAMKVSALILGQSIAQAGLAVLDIKRTSEWAPDIAMNERQMIDAQGLDVLSRLFSAMELSADLFSPISITTISNMIVSEDEDCRGDGLQILVNLVTSSNEMKPLVTTALLTSVETELDRYNLEEGQLLRIIALVRTIWDNFGSPFYSLVNRCIPRLTDIALIGDSTYIRQHALHLAKDVLARGFATEIKNAISETLSSRRHDWASDKHHHILTELLELLEDDGSKDASKKPPYAFAWDYPSNLVVDIFPAVFKKIVSYALYEIDDSVREAVSTLLNKLSKDGRVNDMLKVDALTWLENAAMRPAWREHRCNAVLVLGTFINQLDLTNRNLLKRLIEWAGTDEDYDVQRLSIGLITTICKDHHLSSEVLETVKSTILLVNDKVIKGQNLDKSPLWIPFLRSMAKHVSFPEVIPIILELGSDSEVWENTLMLGECENDPEYTKALESILPQNLNLKVAFCDAWPTTAKWIQLLVALSQRSGLKESVNKILRGIAKDLRDGIEAEPTPNLGKPDLDTHEYHQAQDNKSKHNGAMGYMPQSTLKLPLCQPLYMVGQDSRSAWANILATIASHFPLEFHDAHTILFQMARHDSELDVQYACLKSLIQLTKQAVPRDLITDTINHFDDFHNNPDQRIRFSYMQLLSSIGTSKDSDLPDEVLKKLCAHALVDDDDDCRSEAATTFLNLLKTEDSNQDPSPKERYHEKIEAIVKAHFHEGIEDKSWKVRQSWIKLAATQIKDDEFPGFTKLIDAVIKDSDPGVQAEAMTVLQQLLEDAEFQALPKLIEVAIKEGLNNTTFKSQDTIYSMLQSVELPDPIDSVLAKAIESALAPYAGFSIHSATQAIKLFSHLIGCVPGHPKDKGDSQPRYQNLLGQGCDSEIISWLADIAINNDNANLQTDALQVLKEAYKATDSSTTEMKLNGEVIMAILPMWKRIIAADKTGIIMQLAETLAISDDTAATVAHALTPMLRNMSSSTCATAIAFLLKLYKKCRYSKPELIESPVAEIISLAFDDKDDTEEVRIPAIRLLAAMSLVPASLESTGEGQLGQLTVATSSVLKQIAPLATKFMELLQIEHLRPSVVELLSLMSLDATVRRTITLSIAATAFGSEEHILVGHAELLAQLISDGHLGKTATDYMMVVLAPALVTRPELAPYRLVIMTGLWCRYGQRTPGNDNVPENPADQKELLDWFKFALFGQHITVREAATWRTRYGIWLPRVACKKERDLPPPLT
ncbi:hypothetical protein EST38_g13679 [Candolleomyces aberdarensis]|uniref:DUF6535 domain-containing protein n=1 Tax=Candolleomyces aberdarensis TaxID=2316362 RepID=A0A4Q2D207_9AGAR|nr:hypothetical protein EST38_g13679 [Candolleomyces aberdarensis]